MTKFECGCRIMTDIITLNERGQPTWQHMLKTFVNICGKCGMKQIKFQYMENKLMEKEEQRMEMFFQTDDDDEEDYDEEEYKEQFRNMTDEEIERHIGLERVRNVMEGFEREHGIDKIRRIVKEIKDEKIERRIEENTFDPYNIWSPRTREEHDNYLEVEYQARLKKDIQPEPEN